MLSQLSEKLTAKKAAIYIQVSTHWQIDKDSLKVQRRELTAYVEMVLGITDYVIFEDPGYSAKNTDRPDYQAMIERIRTGEFTHLVVWKIDRISRNLLDFASMYAELKKLGVTFVSKNEQFDTSSAIGEAMLKIILVFAELERQMTSERVTAVMLSRANNGQWNGGHVPYGYQWDKESHAFSIVEHEAKAIKKMAELYEQYQSLLYVAKQLNGPGFPPRPANNGRLPRYALCSPTHGISAITSTTSTAMARASKNGLRMSGSPSRTTTSLFWTKTFSTGSSFSCNGTSAEVFPLAKHMSERISTSSAGCSGASIAAPT